MHKPVIPYDSRCDTFLKNLGLYQVSMIEHCSIDRRLITAFVERWRPETDTFHLPVGECTVTLQDVSCLWGLSITGNLVIGPSDEGLMELVDNCLGEDMCQVVLLHRRNEDSGFRISLSRLRSVFNKEYLLHIPTLQHLPPLLFVLPDKREVLVELVTVFLLWMFGIINQLLRHH